MQSVHKEMSSDHSSYTWELQNFKPKSDSWELLLNLVIKFVSDLHNLMILINFNWNFI